MEAALYTPAYDPEFGTQEGGFLPENPWVKYGIIILLVLAVLYGGGYAWKRDFNPLKWFGGEKDPSPPETPEDAPEDAPEA